LLACLPGHVAIFSDADTVLAVDLIELRAQLVYRRLARDLGGEGVAAQGLLTPVVVKCAREDVEACRDGAAILAGIGIDLEPFGDDAVVVRAVPAQLRHCVDDADVGDLVVRVLPWLRLRRREPTSPDPAADRHAVLAAIAGTRGADPAPRLARRWVRELYEAGELDEIPGVSRWSADTLVGRAGADEDRGDD
jgi:DNA mismatch repair protein MutL